MSISWYDTNYVINTEPAERRGILTNYNLRVYHEALRLLLHAIVFEYCDSPCKHGTPAARDTRTAVVDSLMLQLKSNGTVCRTLLLAAAGTKSVDELAVFLRSMFDRCLRLIKKYNRCAADKLVIPMPSRTRMPGESLNPAAPMDEADLLILRVLAEMAADKKNQYLVRVKKNT